MQFVGSSMYELYTKSAGFSSYKALFFAFHHTEFMIGA